MSPPGHSITAAAVRVEIDDDIDLAVRRASPRLANAVSTRRPAWNSPTASHECGRPVVGPERRHTAFTLYASIEVFIIIVMGCST